ncbi:MAG: arginine--tRNA ligase [Candidatus Eisenbacteria bacterium]|uniref:Arginine--tRNA ligase n=1 Tax=Eiseniibacteriota bacterium TaxID=2212470 RepID=A0A538TB70_UNCEI|nr:MAG: arginine--tRNA ligase [Candidatus Eisenbacteria bacterium]
MPTEKPWPIEAYLAERLEAAIPKAGLMLPEGARIDVEVPREPEHGDWATPVALTLAKTARRPPRQVAETLRDVLVKEIERDVVSSIEIAGAGFINFRLAPAWLTANLARILENPGVYGSSPVGRGEKILIEYVSANPTGPLNVVNARAASIGDALIRILNAAGYEARGEFYANDWGLQAELFGASIETRFQERLGLPASPLPEEGYAGAYVAEVARTVPEQDGRSWLGLPERERRLRFAGWGIDRMLERQKVDLDRFGARMDRWFRESELHRGGAVEKARARLGERGMTETRDGALWFRSTEFGDQEDRVIVRTNGEPTYFLADAAYHHDKFSRGFDRLIDLLGPDHHGHVQRMQGVIEALGWPRERFEVILIQWVRLLRGGEPVKMSKRAGEFITLEDLVQEVGVDAARFFFLMRRAESPLDFDLELAVKRSEDNPVYYVQYAHARIVHVLEYATSQGVPEPSLAAARPDLLHEAETLTLLRGLAGFPSLVAAAARHREPHRIPMYLKDLAARFHSFYHVHRVVGPDAAVTAARLLLTRATGVVFRRGLELLGVSAPESM